MKTPPSASSELSIIEQQSFNESGSQRHNINKCHLKTAFFFILSFTTVSVLSFEIQKSIPFIFSVDPDDLKKLFHCDRVITDYRTLQNIDSYIAVKHQFCIQIDIDPWTSGNCTGIDINLFESILFLQHPGICFYPFSCFTINKEIPIIDRDIVKFQIILPVADCLSCSFLSAIKRRKEKFPSHDGNPTNRYAHLLTDLTTEQKPQ